MNLARFASLLCCGLFFGVAHAEVDLSPDKDRDAQATINVEVPKSQIALEPLRYVPPMPTEFSIGASSWTPNNFARGTYANGTIKFTRDNLPAFAVTRIGQFANLGSGIVLADKFGVGYYAMSRSANILIAGQASKNGSQETINMFSARIGLELQFRGLFGDRFVPIVSLSAMPTYGLAERSSLEDNVGAFGVPVEGTAGILWYTGKGIGLGSQFSLGVSGQYITGSLEGSSLTGFGAMGELRLTL